MNEPGRKTEVSVSPQKSIDDAIARGRAAILRSQKANGAWDGVCELGPSCTAQALIALSYMQRLSSEDAAEGARWLKNQQRKDGSFGGWPYATRGDLGATACAWAALQLSSDPKAQAAAAKARAYIDAHGGFDTVVELASSGDVSAFYLAMAGRLDAKRLPQPPLVWVLSCHAVDFAFSKLTYSVVLGAMSMAILSRRLRGEWDVLTRLSCPRASSIIKTFQNDNGSFNGVTIATALFGATLHATGRSEDRDGAARAASFLLSRRIRDASGMHFDIFPSDVWTTAYHARVLTEAGVPRDAPELQRAVEYLLATQARVPQPRWNNRKSGAVLTGGWAFEDGNPLMPDPDDTAVVLSALGRIVEGLPPALAARVRTAIADGRRWMLDMQNPDGGWGGFAWGLPSKAPGPAMRQPFTLPPITKPCELIDVFLYPPVVLGDPSTEDLSARAIDALLSTGDTPSAPAVQKAIGFLREQQCDFGPWWGRWVVNFLAGSSYVISALTKAGDPPGVGFLKRAIDWTLAHQNEDGGFGESVLSYAEPKRAGIGPSTAPLTGLVLLGLLDAGLRDSAAVQKAIAYLLARQRPDGTWPNGTYLATALPPNAFYTYAPAANYLPLQALAHYARLGDAPAPSVRPSRWTDAVLDPMRQETDPLADELVAEIYSAEAECSVTKLLAQLFRNDAPIPEGMPPKLRDYFESTAALPPWADAKKIARAQQLFATYPVQITMGLFCSALPQAYAAADGAAVLVQTQAMQRNTRQRIFETAQFVFDVVDEGAFSPGGKGIRAAQRVRLMHAAIRHLILSRKDVPWNSAVRGKPINQEDMAGTLMTFSALTFDALRRYGIDASDADGEAWIHAWTVVGHFMGIEPSLMPTSLADAEALMDAIRDRQWAPSPEGRALTEALLEMMNQFFTFDLTALRGIMPTQIRFLVGDHCADLLNVPQSNLTGLLDLSTDLLRELDVPNHDAAVAKILGRFADDAMKLIVLAEREGKQASFRLPSSLEKSVVPGT
ncbi:oxygenase MpaB family protein [Pyxidicoccus xibeiensis]|uniref:oxygenase MpaB family protein n=1 Tax=Pyxidicoccus xibeiensis TaxID=2906759 RepID=UPI0020A7B958|nr:oxygenase MpaB family protein [Pyxidicoccus xibeiensis]MCP3142069.1 oxygenase MpaB family protein [Pyxidicoccus xibeiensis]